MKRLLSITLLATLLLVGFQSCQEPQKQEILAGPEYSEQIKQIIDAKNAKAEAWYLAGNVDSLASIFASNSIQMPPNMPPLVGIEGYKAGWTQNLQFGKWDFNLETQEVKASGNLATEWGKYTVIFTPNDNSPIPPMNDKGNYVVLWEKIDGDWKIVWDAPVSEIPLPMPVMDSIPE
ncbi:YybH family protein [Flagellimonas sp. GZD32]|uniref:YybH family protein n=1 Tax=Flagellimonas cixiensis TaxID=3228750 RepID=UPI0035C8ECE7